MSGRKLIGMVLALAILAAIAVVQKRVGRSDGNTLTRSEATLLEGVDLNAFTALDVVEGSNAVSLVKQDGKWVVGSLHGYPVDFDALADAIRNAAEMELGRPVRAGNVALSEFGLGDGNAKEIVLKSGDSAAVSIQVGARREASDVAGAAGEYFVRKAGDEAIYLIDFDFSRFPVDPEDWIDTSLLNVKSTDIVSVVTDDAELKEDAGQWVLAGLEAETEELQAAEANRLRSALQYLYCTTVADPGMTDAELGFTNSVMYTARDRDGLLYTAKIGGECDDGRYARFAVAYEKPEAPTAPGEDADQEKKDAYQNELNAFNTICESNRKKGDELESKLSGWTYVISSHEAGDFLIARDRLVKEKEPPLDENVEE